jgi:nucleotide-binding universal stress UspA family protein
MKNYFKILVASDYSKAGVNAEHYAIQLAKETNSILTFFHVFEEPYYLREQINEFEILNENPVKQEAEDLRQHIADIYISMGMNPQKEEYHCIVRQGFMANELYMEAESSNVDFIIAGTHEADFLQSVIEGSHTWELIKNSEVPVLAIPENTKYENIKHIVFATEYRKGELPVINFLASIAKQLDAELTILHIYNDVFSKEFERDIFDRFKREVKTLIDYDRLSIVLIHNNDLVEGLNSFCASVNANWLVMSHEKTVFFVSLFNPPSVTKKMSLHTQVPLLAVPDSYKPQHETGKRLQGNGDIKNADMYKDFFADA